MRARPWPLALYAALALILAVPAGAAPVSPAQTSGLVLLGVLGVDRVGEDTGLAPSADLLALELYRQESGARAVLRLSFLALAPQGVPSLMAAEAAAGRPGETVVSVRAPGLEVTTALRRADDGRWVLPVVANGDKRSGAAWYTVPGDPDAIYLPLDVDPAQGGDPWPVSVRTAAGTAGDAIDAAWPAEKAYEAHCALVLHGNQGLGYTDVLHGRGDDPEGSGFDEALQVHQGTAVPGNFHMSGTLMTAAEWAARNGDPVDFNAWLAAGVTAGWAGMVTSAYGQHIMPFVNHEMNDWAVSIESDMIAARYGYTPRVGWVPERVWLNTAGYPSAGVNDWIADNWQPHGVWGVILDDDVHLTGHDNHRIHREGNTNLALVPRDRTFTGNIVGGNGQGALNILTGLAGSGVGQYRLAVAAEDWEAIGEMGGWATITPNAKETYDWFVGKCQTESAWLHTWKLADALANPDFTGDTISVAPGTYNEIGGSGGYGGGNNGWYTHWAGWVPYANGGNGSGACAGAGGNCKNYGTLWNDAFNALMAAPDNNVSQAGWYVLMTNLHETAWHDGMGGPISGWQHKYSAHIKNAMVYAEAAHWAAGEYAVATNAYLADIDNDGYQEAVLHNDRLFAVFEGNGGRLVNLFVRGPGYNDTAIGVDNAYWSDTEGDYNDANHVGAFSDVSPDYQHTGYAMVPAVGGGSASLTLTHAEVTKTLSLAAGEPFCAVTYSVGSATHWIKSGFSPSLVDLVWNAELQRVWAGDASYMGFRNPNTGLVTALVLGDGGATHQGEISGTLMRGDEIRGSGVFQCLLYAGLASAPGVGGEIAELRALADDLQDTIGPSAQNAAWYPQTDRLVIAFDQPASLALAVGLTLAGTGGEVGLGAGTTVVGSQPSLSLTLAVDPATAALIEAQVALGALSLRMAAGSVTDAALNGNGALVAPGLPVAILGTSVVIDGRVEAGEWAGAQVLDDANDSAWTAANEIDRLLVKWDAEYLYVAIDGQVSGNSWLLYLDVNPGSGLGQTNLAAINAWERGAAFTAPGFAPDFQYGCYQHQSQFDGDGFWQLLSPTTTQDRGGEIASAFDSFHTFGSQSGSELAIPWHTLYGLGAGMVPAGAQVSLVASVCWDPEPAGVLGGDSAPSNLAAALPVVDNAWAVVVDGNGDGVPDGTWVASAPPTASTGIRLLPNQPNPFNPATIVHFAIDGDGATDVSLAVFDLGGRLVRTLADGSLEPGLHRRTWDGRDARGRAVAAGTYFARLSVRGQVVTRPLSLVK
ncbi:MAG: hypothetical protein IPK64_13035 [bacterium]|nr:hypothetical protein [bacterium]